MNTTESWWYQGVNTHDQPVNQLSFAHDVPELPQQPWLPPGIHFLQKCWSKLVGDPFLSISPEKKQRKLHNSGCLCRLGFKKITWAAGHGKPLPGQDLVHCRASLFFFWVVWLYVDDFESWGHISNGVVIVVYILLCSWSWQKNLFQVLKGSPTAKVW